MGLGAGSSSPMSREPSGAASFSLMALPPKSHLSRGDDHGQPPRPGPGGEITGPRGWVGQRPAVFGQVEILDREPARDTRSRRGSPSTASEVDDAGGIVDVQLRSARVPPCRSCTWSAYGSSSSGSPPQSATWPVSIRRPQPRHLGHHRPAGLGRVHHRAGPRLEQRARRGPEPAHAALPHPVGPHRRGGRAPPRSRLGERGRAAHRQREGRRDRRPTMTSMCAKPSAAATLGAGRDLGSSP